MSHALNVSIVGVGFSRPERPAYKPLELHTREAIGAALADAGMDASEIDGLSTYPTAPFVGAGSIDGIVTVSVDYAARHFGFPNIRWCSESSWGLIAAAFGQAVAALSAGLCSNVVVWRSMHVPARHYGAVDEATAAGGEEQFQLPWQLHSPVQWHALAYRNYLERFGYNRGQLAELVLSSRANALKNPYAFFNDRPISESEYSASRMISDPLSLYDCDIPIQGATALVLTTNDRAKDTVWSAQVAGVAVNVPKSIQSLHYTLDDYMVSGGSVATELHEQSGIGPSEIDVAQLYDGFAPSAVYWLEAAGFCGRGEGMEFIQDGQIRIDGPLPVNTFGGSLSAGRMHGLTHIVEAALQVSGRATDRQVSGAQAACAYVGSPMLGGGGIVVTADR